jgi:N-methylhydantoinase A
MEGATAQNTVGDGHRYRVGVDIGGTFTDVVVLDESDGTVRVTKVPTVPADPSQGFLDGLGLALEAFSVAPEAIAFAVHGTTIATNTIIQGQGARSGLITSEGFSDILEIAYQTRPELYEIFYDKPPPLIPRYLCIGVPERIDAHGNVLTPLDEAAVETAARRLVAEGVESIAVAFLHSYRDPTHEQLAASAIKRVAPGLPVVLSSDVCPEYREYPRTSTAVVNAVLTPKVTPYLARLETRLAEMKLAAGLHLMTSNGGIITSGTAKRLPVTLVESGPAAGVIGAAFIARLLDDERLGARILALDIGGTTAKAALVDDGVPALADEFEVGASAMPTTTSGRGRGYPVKMAVISLVEIGAGGGSIAGIDPGGALQVGPNSAGADPGPACYGLGGGRATITDANLVLGRLNPDYFLGGRLPIHPALAEAAIERDVARPMGIDLASAARAIIDIANARMVAALQLVSIRRGIDPRDYALVASGGSGPVHVMAIADALGIGTVIIPPTPGLNSAVGLLATDIKHEFVRAVARPTRSLDRDTFAGIVAEMDAKARDLLRGEAVGRGRMEVLAEADVCYLGQNYPLRIPLPGRDGEVLESVDKAFRAEHRRLYGFASDTEATVILNLRFTAIGHVERPRLKPLADGDTDPKGAVKAHRAVVFDRPLRCPIYDRDRLLAGNVIAGPAIVEQMDTTVLLPPGSTARVDRTGTLVATVRAS